MKPDGDMTQAPGRWLADPQTLERLGIQTDGSAVGEDFIALMEGRHPQSGMWLRRAGADGGRGGGIDGVLSAPKSVSTVWALADPWQREQIEQAHANAVEQAVAYMRQRVPVVRRRYGAEVVEEPAKDLIAVEYRHTTARGVSGAEAPDPQLHSHVVITSVVREDDRIVAVASRPVFRATGEVGAFYRSALAQELIRQGYPVERATGKDGKYFEIAGVPEELRDAFSGRSREGGRMTTLAVRAQEQAIERRAATLAQPAERDVGHTARMNAAREVAERIGAPLSDEQEMALLVLTGPERASVLVGPAGTGKGVVIDAAARAEQLAGRETLGIAVSGSTAERLGNDSPTLQGSTLTLDALVARANTGTVHVGPDTTIFLDEAGMVDHKRLDALTELVERSGAKLIAVGDGKQLPSIGPGGTFDRLTRHAPTVELERIHRTTDPHEQKAWQALRAGESERAMAHYQAQGRLHLADTRDQAAENAVQAWAQLADEVGICHVALIADASNKEIDRLNARAQHLRAQRGELGPDELPLSTVNYGLRQGDHVAFIAQHRPPGQPRVENGTRGEVTKIDQDGTLALKLDGSDRIVRLAGEEVESLRLGYAAHVYRQQGATVDRAVVLTGSWQTSKETAYVEASRARQGTDWFVSREDLGVEGHDTDRIGRLAGRMTQSRARTPSVIHREIPGPSWDPSRDPLRLSRLIPHVGQLIRTPARDAPDRDVGRGR